MLIKSTLIAFVGLIVFFLECRAGEDDEETEKVISCRERYRKIVGELGDLYKVVEVVAGETLMLQCHYCNENDDEQPKNWFRVTNFTTFMGDEVKLDMDNNLTISKVHVNLEHTLIIHNTTESDVGIYYCYGLEEQEKENKYRYLVDVIYKVNVSQETGNITHWKTYHDEQFKHLNVLFKESNGIEYKYLRDELKISMQAITTWDDWGPCELCGRPQGQGRRKREGICRVKINKINNETLRHENFTELFISNAYEISCRSQILGKLCPGISNVTKIIPNFAEVEKCEGICNPDAEGQFKGWKSTKKGFKYRKTFVLAQGSHLTIVCPESTLENIVQWKKNGKLLEPGESVPPPDPEEEPRITVDTFNTLYLHDVTREEEGNYTCYVDKIRMQQVNVFVVSKSKLLTQAMVRHMMYLAFVMSLTISCYCAGLVITWSKRHKFKSYEELKLLNPEEDEDEV